MGVGASCGVAVGAGVAVGMTTGVAVGRLDRICCTRCSMRWSISSSEGPQASTARLSVINPTNPHSLQTKDER
jgi:hypothetical protein